MGKHMADNRATAELIRERGRELTELIIGELADDLLRQGLWDDIGRLTIRQLKLVKAGARKIVTEALKTETMENGERAWYCVEDGPKARWMYWRFMARRDSRAAYFLLRKKAKEVNREVKQYRKMHIERFNEDPEPFAKKAEAKAHASE